MKQSQIANIIGPTLHIDWVIGVWLRSHVHDWANVGVVVHLHAIFADVGPILANDLLLQRIMKVIFFHRNKLLAIVINDVLIPCRHTTFVDVVQRSLMSCACWDRKRIFFLFFIFLYFFF